MNLAPGNLDTLFLALADPTRRAILEQLAKGPAAVSDLARPFDMSLPGVMDHLRKLQDAGLVTTAKSGRTRTVTLVTDSYAPVRDWLEDQRAIWEARLDRLENFALNTSTGAPK